MASIIGSLLVWALGLFGFGKPDPEKTGRKLQAADDSAASIAAATGTRTDEDNVHRLSDDELNNRLRGP